jgi:hypothetical protein
MVSYRPSKCHEETIEESTPVVDHGRLIAGQKHPCQAGRASSLEPSRLRPLCVTVPPRVVHQCWRGALGTHLVVGPCWISVDILGVPPQKLASSSGHPVLKEMGPALCRKGGRFGKASGERGPAH